MTTRLKLKAMKSIWLIAAVAAIVCTGTLRGNAVEATENSFVMIGLGDSFGSGMGAPNVPGTTSHGASWTNFDCHRSVNAPTLLAGKSLQTAFSSAQFALDVNSHIPVFACAGAAIRDIINQDQVIQTVTGPITIRKQLDQVKTWMDKQFPRTVFPHRKIDALIISIGGNDLDFETIGIGCFVSPIGADCNQPQIGTFNNPFYVGELFNNDFANLTKSGGSLDQLILQIASQLADTDASGNVTSWVKNVYLTEYPDLPRDAQDNFCNRSPLPDLEAMSAAESQWASQIVVGELNLALSNAVARANANLSGASSPTVWHIIPMGTGSSNRFKGHGVCADSTPSYVPGMPVKRFINTAWDSLLIQSGPTCNIQQALSSVLSFSNFGTPGVVGAPCDPGGWLHPNLMGYETIRDAIVETVMPLFAAPAPPRATVTNVSAASIDFGWSVSQSGAADMYQLQYRSALGSGSSTVLWNEGRRFTMRNPSPGQVYEFDLRACNNSVASTPLCSAPTVLTVAYQAPPAPSNARLTVVRGHGVPVGDPTYSRVLILQWNDNSSTETRFEIEAETGGAWQAIKSVSANTTSFSLSSGLVDLSNFDAYRVRACAWNLCSGYSNVVMNVY